MKGDPAPTAAPHERAKKGGLSHTVTPPASSPADSAPRPEQLDHFALQLQGQVGQLVQRLGKEIYPVAARAQHLEGTADVKVDFTKGGQIKEVVIAKTSGHEILDQRAIEMVQAAMLPVPEALKEHSFSVVLPMQFKLRRSDELEHFALQIQRRLGYFVQKLGAQAYPVTAHEQELEGTVNVRINFKKGGQLKQIALAQTSGHEILDQRALELAQAAVLPVPAALKEDSFSVVVPVHFHLRSVLRVSGFYLVLGPYSREVADQHRMAMMSKGYTASVVADQPQLRWKVYVGPFPNRKAADKPRSELAAQSLPAGEILEVR